MFNEANTVEAMVRDLLAGPQKAANLPGSFRASGKVKEDTPPYLTAGWELGLPPV